MVVSRDGVKVSMDGGEKAKLTGDAASEAREINREVLQVSVPMHTVHNFTDVWAVDGSKSEGREKDGKVRRRVAAGAYEGVQPLARAPPGMGETQDEYERRCVGQGMMGARLPAHMEVVDAELYAVLLAVREVSRRTGAAQRRCLVMSDSISALRMVEAAWRRGVKATGGGRNREAILEAINTYRGKLEKVVTMYVPAHAGVSPNAMADAVAKAYLQQEMNEEEVSAAVEEGLAAGRWVRKMREGRSGGTVLWDRTAFDATREAIGWWVRAREWGRLTESKTAIDAQRIGRPWEERSETRWDAVWEGTGARPGGMKKGAAEGEEGGGTRVSRATQKRQGG